MYINFATIYIRPWMISQKPWYIAVIVKRFIESSKFIKMNIVNSGTYIRTGYFPDQCDIASDIYIWSELLSCRPTAICIQAQTANIYRGIIVKRFIESSKFIKMNIVKSGTYIRTGYFPDQCDIASDIYIWSELLSCIGLCLTVILRKASTSLFQPQKFS
jgi:hypothetical protein